MFEDSKQYFHAGIFAIVFFSLAISFVYLGFDGPASNEHTAKITLAIQNETSGTDSFSAFIGEDALFSEKHSILRFSSKDGIKTGQITCTINCQWNGD